MLFFPFFFCFVLFCFVLLCFALPCFALLCFGQNDQKTNSAKFLFSEIVFNSWLTATATCYKDKLYLSLYLCINISFEFEAAIADIVLPCG